MLKRFTAQNFDNELYTALDFTESDAFLFPSIDGDISLLRRFIQLMWASTIEDGIGLQFSLKTSDHTVSSTSENIYLDKAPVVLSDMEKFYDLKFTDYSKNFVITYTQLLNLELSRTEPVKYLNKYIFHKSDSKSYYSPIEDVLYDIEQASKYASTALENSEGGLENNVGDRIKSIKDQISHLENIDTSSTVSNEDIDRIKEIEDLIENQKQQSSLISEKEDLSRQLDILSKKTRSYEDALEKISKVDVDLDKHKSFINLDPEKVEKDLSLFTYRVREREKTLSELSHRPAKYVHEEKAIALLPVIVLLTISTAFGITLSFLTSPLLGLSITFIFCSCVLLYFIFAHRGNPSNSDEIITKTQLDSLSHEIDTLKIAKYKYLNNLGFNNEDDYFATKALVRVLLYQKEDELSVLHKAYDGKEISDLKMEQEAVKKQLAELDEKIKEFGAVISQEEFIKNRRELDILKLEASSKTMDTSSSEKNDKLEQLKSELKGLEDKGQNGKSNPLDEYLNIIKSYYNNQEIQLSDNYILENIKTENYEQKVEMMIVQRIAYIKSKYPDVDLPVILEDPFTGVEDRGLIKRILEFCVDNYQVILISEHESYKDLGLKVIKDF